MPLKLETAPQSTAFLRHSAPVGSALSAFVLGALLVVSPAVVATTYKWVDDQGVVHYLSLIHI